MTRRTHNRINTDSDFEPPPGADPHWTDTRDLDHEILLCLDAIESKGTAECLEGEILKALLAKRREGETKP